MKKAAICIFLATTSIAACNQTPDVVELSDSEAALFAAAGIDADAALEIRKHGTSVERLQGLDENWEYYDANAIVLLTEENQGDSALRTLRSILDGNRYAAYLLDQGFGFGPDSIAVLANTDSFFYLQTVRINGINYDIEHADVMKRLRKWDDLYGLRLYGAGMDWLQAEFDTPPRDWAAFAEEVYEFCPDVVDQGTGSVEALATELKKIRGVYLWWD